MWKSPDNLWSIYCPVDAECNCPGLQQSGPGYRSFSSDLLTAKCSASLKLMQYFLSYLSLSYEFVYEALGINQSDAQLRLQHCTGCWKLSQQWHPFIEIMKWLKSHLGVDDQSHLDDIVTMIRMTLIRIIRVLQDVLQDDDVKYWNVIWGWDVSHNPNISRPISVPL